MMHRTFSLFLAAAFALHTAPALGAAAQAMPSGTVTGVAQSTGGQTLGDHLLRLRSVQTGQVVGSTTSNAAGSFTFLGINPGSYVVEIVNAAGQVVGTSGVTTVAAGSTLSVTVVAASTVATVGGAASPTVLLLLTAAGAAGVAGIVVAANKADASPSR